jgi:hypothetical protein
MERRTGEQYLFADPEIRQETRVLDASREWLTLDAPTSDHRAANSELEGWSCFATGAYMVVARLVSHGIYTGRPAYFSHARLGRLTDFDNGVDFGSLLGRPEAFDRPYRDSPQPPEPVALPQLDTPLPASFRSQIDVAIGLLAHSYDMALDGNRRPIIVAAPISLFRAGSWLPEIVSFARVALPWPLKRKFAVRIYTRNVRNFLQQGANLLAVPDDQELHFDDRQALVLRLRDTGLEGPPPSAPASTYARTLANLFVMRPKGLLPCSGRIPDFLSSRERVSKEGAFQALPAIYAFAVAGNSQANMDEALRFFVRKEEEEALPWHEILDARDWADFSDDALIEAVLMRASGPTHRALQELALKEATRRGVGISEGLNDWWSELPLPERLPRLLELFDRRLISESTVRQLVGSVSAEEIAGIAQPSRILRFAAFDRLNEGPEALIRIAADPDALQFLVANTLSGNLRRTWLEGAVHGWRSRDFGRLIDVLRREIANRGTRWFWLAELVVHRLNTESDLPGNAAMLAEDLASPWTREFLRQSLTIAFAVEELCVRCSRKSSSLAEIDTEQLKDEEWKQTVDWALGRGKASGGIALLKRNRELRMKDAVLRNYASTLIAAPGICDDLSMGALLRLAAALDWSCPGAIPEILDRSVRDNPDQAVATLVRENCWLTWRRLTNLQGAELRRAAWSWWQCDLWRGPSSRTHPTLEAWGMVLRDLDHLEEEEIRKLSERRSGAGEIIVYPVIPFLEDEQMALLCRLPRDAGALAGLAEALDARFMPRGQQAAEFAWSNARPALQQCPVQAFQRLVDRGKPQSARGVLSVYDAEVLCRFAGTRIKKAMAELQTAVAESLFDPATAPDAIAAGDRCTVWDKEALLTHLRTLLTAGLPLDEATEQELDRRITKTTVQKPAAQDRQPAIRMLERGRPMLAALIFPGVTLPAPSAPAPAKRDEPTSGGLPAVPQSAPVAAGSSGPLDEREIFARCARSFRSPDAPCWDWIDQLVAGWLSGQVRNHPLLSLVEYIREASDTGVPPRWADIRQLLARRQSWLTPASGGAPLPALTFAAAVCGDGLLAIVQGMVQLPAAGPFARNPDWWVGLMTAAGIGARAHGYRNPQDAGIESIFEGLIKMEMRGEIQVPSELLWTIRDRFRMPQRRLPARI